MPDPSEAVAAKWNINEVGVVLCQDGHYTKEDY